jgi:hypothetical protein
METNNLEQSYAIKFCVQLQEGVTDTCAKIQKAFGNDSEYVLKYFGGTNAL